MPADLSRLGGPKEGKIFEGVIQELDITTGRVLFEWRSEGAHRARGDYAKVPPAKQGAKAAPYDYFHLNSVEEDVDGNFILSARHTHGVYKIARGDGRVMWRLGGKRATSRTAPARVSSCSTMRAASPTGR